MQYKKKYKNQAGMNLTPPPSQNSHIIIIIIPAKAFARDYVITGVRLSVQMSVCLFVCYHDN